ncbi:hypothetical protein H5410_023304 [Solanum commersonii]|uniref:phosphoribosylformylglycinamidine cyclo-ligase n=1 Tax=Solanum commersonii TaxID=4109 RepID=A0A9J5ZIT6_SOLCO|nr:hypothetical protein H5410_023304 [Solanum commersonii]
MNTSCGANLELSRCIAASPVCHFKSSIFEPRSCVPKLQDFSKKLLPLCKDINARSNRERSIPFSVTCSASQVDTAADEPSSLTYKDAGVDIDAGSELVKRIAKMAPGIGGFGGLFPLVQAQLRSNPSHLGWSKWAHMCHYLRSLAELCPPRLRHRGRDHLVFLRLIRFEPEASLDQTTSFHRFILHLHRRFTGGTAGDSYLVAGTDGVGTKLKLAFETGIHDTIGIDLICKSQWCLSSQVAMSVNDIVTSGAKPLFFLDYFATSRLDVDLAEKVIKGIVDGCQQSDCALLGGETAEMPDFYAEGEYDLSGFAVGIVKKDSVIDGKNIKVGDVLIGLPSSGVHSNGFSLVRRVLKQSGLSLKDQLPGESITLGEALIAPTVIYVKQVLDIISKGGVKGIAHITGGGFTDNIPRVFPKGLGALVYEGSWTIPPVCKWIQEAGRIEDAEMMRTFNMGVGMVLVVSPEAADRILMEVQKTNIAYRIGEVVKGDGVSYS